MDDPKVAGSRDNRRATRHLCNIPAVIVVDRVRHDVRIKDVSALGCCFSNDGRLDKGDELLCEIRGLHVVATVAWSNPPLHGANFHREIDLKVVLRKVEERPAFLNRRLAGSMTGIRD